MICIKMRNKYISQGNLICMPINYSKYEGNLTIVCPNSIRSANLKTIMVIKSNV